MGQRKVEPVDRFFHHVFLSVHLRELLKNELTIGFAPQISHGI